jgi:SSS family solute:Na+ symporter
MLSLPLEYAVFFTVVILLMLLWFIRRGLANWRRFSFTKDYFIWGNQSLNLGEYRGTFTATNITFTSSFLAVAVLAFTSGGKVIWLILSFFIGMLLFAFLYKRTVGVWVTKHDFGSLHEFLMSRYGSASQKVGSLVTVIAFIGTLALEFLGIQIILDALQPHMLNHGVVLIVFFGILAGVFLYTIFGGFREVVISDILQFYIIMIGLLFAIVAIAYAAIIDPSVRLSITSHVFQAFRELTPLDTPFIISMLILFLPFQFCVMDMWQRCRAARDNPSAIIKGTIQGAFYAIIPLIMGALCGLVLRTEFGGTGPPLTPHETNLIFFNGLGSLLAPLAGGTAYFIALTALAIALIMAAVSSIDTLLNSILYTIFIDLWGPQTMANPSSNMALNIPFKAVRFLFFGIGLIIICISISLTLLPWSFQDYAFAVFSSQVAFFIPLLIAFLAPKSGKWFSVAVPISLIVAVVTPIIVVFAGKSLGNQDIISGAPLIGFLLALLVMGITGLFGLLRYKGVKPNG